mgnify:FL=1
MNFAQLLNFPTTTPQKPRTALHDHLTRIRTLAHNTQRRQKMMKYRRPFMELGNRLSTREIADYLGLDTFDVAHAMRCLGIKHVGQRGKSYIWEWPNGCN